jgi:hypothetical protein
MSAAKEGAEEALTSPRQDGLETPKIEAWGEGSGRGWRLSA